MPINRPSSEYVQAWYGHVMPAFEPGPLSSHSFAPRWRQTFAWACTCPVAILHQQHALTCDIGDEAVAGRQTVVAAHVEPRRVEDLRPFALEHFVGRCTRTR